MTQSRTQEWWDHFFLGMAQYVSTASKDPSTRVGAVITKGKEVVSVGYNGFSQNDPDVNLEDRDNKLSRIIHGEINAILFAKRDLTGCTLYTYPFLPCSHCASIVSQVGIKRVVSLKNTVDRWEENISLGKEIFGNGGIEVVEYE